MDESVLLDSDVNEGSESCDVGDYAGKHHSLFEIFNAVDVRGELEGLGFIARVSAGLCKFLENVIDCRKAEIPFYEILRLNLGTEFGVSDNFRYLKLVMVTKSERYSIPLLTNFINSVII